MKYVFVALLALAAGLTASADVSAQAPATGALQIDYTTLFESYISTRPDLANDPKFVEDYAKYTRCTEWRTVHDNEFKYQEFLTEVRGQLLQEIAKPAGPLFRIRTMSPFGQYDFQSKEFPFQPLHEGDAFTFDFGFRPGVFLADSNCRPTDFHWPAKIFLAVANPWAIDGLPMAPEAAQRLVNRNPALYQRELGLSLVLKLGTPSDIKLDPARAPYPGFVEATAEIVSAAVDDGATSSPKTIFVTDENYLKTRNAAHASIQTSKAADEAAFNGDSIEATAGAVDKIVKQFANATSGAAPALPPDDPSLRVLLQPNVAYHTANGQFAGVLGLAANVDIVLSDESEFSLRGSSTPFRVDNAAEFKAIAVPPDVITYAQNAFPTIEETLFVKPIGYVHDEFIGTFLMTHVMRVALALRDPTKPQQKVWVIESKTPAAPFAPLADQRTAADFEVIGIKGGMSLDDVRAEAEKEMGQTLIFDEKAMTLTSPAPNCDFNYDSTKTPPGRRCFRAEFRVAETGLISNKLAMVRATYRQAAYRPSSGDLTGLLAKKYGPAVYRTQISDNHGGLMVTSESIQEIFLEWGKRMTANRQGMVTPGVHVPVHALEAEIQIGGDLALLTLTLTGQALADQMNGGDAAAAAAKKLEEDRKKAADVKL